MDRRNVLICALALGLCGATGPSASASGISSTGVSFTTGNVEKDMPNTAGNGVFVVPGTSPTGVGQAKWMTDAGYITGWNIKDLRFAYNSTSDTLSVGVNTYSIAGNADGNGKPGSPDPKMVAAGGVDPAHIGGRGSITVAFAPSETGAPSKVGTPVIVAGVPADKSSAGTGLDGFTVSSYKPSGQGIQYNYGMSLAANTGALAFDPSAAHPGFEFTVKNFSKIPGLDPKTGFWIQAFAGSPDDVIAGEDSIGWIHVPGLAAQQTVPEPTTFAGWTLLTAGAAWGLRRSRRRSVQA
jgi:MYXO-CTERM domain-containing protein